MSPCSLFNQMTKKDETSDTDTALVHGLKEVRVEPEDFHTFHINLSKGNEVTSNSSESLRCLEKSTENRTGKFESNFTFFFNFVLYNQLFIHKKNHLCFNFMFLILFFLSFLPLIYDFYYFLLFNLCLFTVT